jgi:hypothetical protein
MKTLSEPTMRQRASKRGAGSILSGCTFDEFLLAPISEDNNGMPLTVLSALARRDLDPWEEAAALGRLPQTAATCRLASFIAALPDGPSARPDPEVTAARLIALLPRAATSLAPLRPRFPGVGMATHSSIIESLLFYWIFIGFVLATQWVMTNRLTESQLHDKLAPASGAVLPQTPPSDPISGVK